MTKKTILKKLQKLSVKELKNLNNALTVTGQIPTWYYTWQELYNMHYKGNIQKLLSEIQEVFIDVNKPWVFYDPYEYHLTLRAISEKALTDRLENNTEDYANILYENQDHYDLEEVFTRWTQDK